METDLHSIGDGAEKKECLTKKPWHAPRLEELSVRATAVGDFIPGGENFLEFLAPCVEGEPSLLCPPS